MPEEIPLSGRRAQAARNDALILDAAREVFVADPSAPISTVAERAGVGISALYRRYPSKEELLGTLCAIGQEVYLDEVERALADDGDRWEAYLTFLRRIVEADTHALTVSLAGAFTPTPEHLATAEKMRLLSVKLFERTKATGKLRRGLTFLDVGYLLEALSSLRTNDPARTNELRQRYLAVLADGLSATEAPRLPGRAPTWAEQSERWVTDESPVLAPS
jgi:AcrR family transcriptional regulator